MNFKRPMSGLMETESRPPSLREHRKRIAQSWSSALRRPGVLGFGLWLILAAGSDTQARPASQEPAKTNARVHDAYGCGQVALSGVADALGLDAQAKQRLL